MLVDSCEAAQYLRALDGETGHPQGVIQFGSHACPGIARDGNVVDLTDREARFRKAMAYCLRGESRRVLHPVETFLFDRGD